MKRFTELVLMIALIFTLTGCGISQADYNKLKNENDELSALPYAQDLIQKSIFVTDVMIKKADRDYLLMNTTDPDLMSFALSYGQIKNSELERAVVLSFSDSALNLIIDTLVSDDIAINSTFRKIIRQRMLMTCGPMINGQYGATQLAAMSFLQHQEAFQKPSDPEFSGNHLVILLYDVSPQDNNWKAVSFVAFHESEQSTIIANANFVANNDDIMSNALYDDREYILDNLRETGLFFIPEDGVTCLIYEGTQLNNIPAYIS